MDKAFELSERKTNTRDSAQTYKLYTLDDSEQLFLDTIRVIDKNINYAKSLIDNNLDVASELLRYQIVLVESAFDFFCHSIIKYGMIQIFHGEWKRTDKYNNFSVKFSQIDSAKAGINEDWILEMVDNKISTQTFLGYEELKDGLNYIQKDCLKEIAKDIYGTDEYTSLQEINADISRVYKRRNEIAHQNDCEHKTGVKKTITLDEVEELKAIIIKIVNSILKTLRSIPSEAS